MNRITELKQEREALQKRLDFLGLVSTGSERHEARISAIDAELANLSLFKPPETRTEPQEDARRGEDVQTYQTMVQRR